MRRLTIALLALIVAGVLFCVLFTFIGKPYETVMLDRFGEIIQKPTRICYNWYLRWPTDSIVRMDMRKHLYQSNNREISTNLGKPILVRSFAAWRIMDPVKFYMHLPGGDAQAQRYINRYMESAIGDVMGGYHLDDLFSVKKQNRKMVLIEDKVQAKANRHLSGLGLRLSMVGFSRIAFPPDVAMSVYHRMTAERAKLADRYRSQGDSEANAIEAKGNEQAAETLSKAERAAKEIRGNGDAKAYAILNAAQSTPQVRKFYRFWKAMQLFRTSLGKGTYFVLTPNNPITAPLFNQMEMLQSKKSKAPPAQASARGQRGAPPKPGQTPRAAIR